MGLFTPHSKGSANLADWRLLNRTTVDKEHPCKLRGFASQFVAQAGQDRGEQYRGGTLV